MQVKCQRQFDAESCTLWMLLNIQTGLAGLEKFTPIPIFNVDLLWLRYSFAKAVQDQFLRPPAPGNSLSEEFRIKQENQSKRA